jgi:murein DD-endopeptidase MepM/ murein hydrolase activator NlpD
MCLFLVATACSPSSALRSLGSPSTAYERYAESLREAGLDSTAAGRDWLAASDSALENPLNATLPAREVGVYSRTEARAVAYRIALKDGQRLRASVKTEGLPAKLFFDLFEVTADTSKPFEHRASATASADSLTSGLTLIYEARQDTLYILRLQPELLRSGRYEITMNLEPILAFPVAGSDNRSIQSGFGVDRDGGARSHAGIDIFAPRGTPVLAATAGTVQSLRPNSLGGNVVWLYDSKRRQSLYYAHLDSQAVREGDEVAIGDTLGFVGNTGNARTTAPHLHFGIYQRGRGPIDPLNWVRIITAQPPRLTVDTTALGRRAIAVGPNATLRSGPSQGSSVVGRIPRDTTMWIMAASASWLRVQLEDGTAGYVSPNAVRMKDER